MGFDVANHMSKVRRAQRPMKKAAKAKVKAMFPNLQKMADKGRRNIAIQYNYKDFHNIMAMASDEGIKALFLDASGEGSRVGVTVVRQFLARVDPNFRKKNLASNVHPAIKRRMIRPSTKHSIYRAVADELNIFVNPRNFVIQGHVGDDPSRPFLGSRGYELARLVEGLAYGQPKAPVNMGVMPSVGFTQDETGYQFISVLPGRTKPTERFPQGKYKKHPFKVSRNLDRKQVEQVPVDKVEPHKFLDMWLDRTVQAIMQEMLDKFAQGGVGRGWDEI